MTAAQPGLGYSMMFPPGWKQFHPDVESEKTLTELATKDAKQLGRLDVVMAIRQHTHRMFEGLRRRGALSMYLPVAVPEDLTVPASLTVVPVRVPEHSNLAQVVQGRTDGVTPEQLSVDGATWFYWVATEDELDGSDEAGSKTLHYVVPRPELESDEPRAALHLIYSYTVLADDRDGEYAQALETLGHSIVGTFQWGPQA